MEELGAVLDGLERLICKSKPQQMLAERLCPMLTSPFGPILPPVDAVGQPSVKAVPFMEAGKVD